MRPSLTFLSLSAVCVAISACAPQSPYAERCNGIALGTQLASLPAARVESGVPGLGRVLRSEPGWQEKCGASCDVDAGCPRVSLPDGGWTLATDVCGEHYTLSQPYRGDTCNAGGIVEHCDAWVRDGGVIATHAFCMD